MTNANREIKDFSPFAALSSPVVTLLYSLLVLYLAVCVGVACKLARAKAKVRADHPRRRLVLFLAAAGFTLLAVPFLIPVLMGMSVWAAMSHRVQARQHRRRRWWLARRPGARVAPRTRIAGLSFGTSRLERLRVQYFEEYREQNPGLARPDPPDLDDTTLNGGDDADSITIDGTTLRDDDDDSIVGTSGTSVRRSNSSSSAGDTVYFSHHSSPASRGGRNSASPAAPPTAYHTPEACRHDRHDDNQSDHSTRPLLPPPAPRLRPRAIIINDSNVDDNGGEGSSRGPRPPARPPPPRDEPSPLALPSPAYYSPLADVPPLRLPPAVYAPPAADYFTLSAHHHYAHHHHAHAHHHAHHYAPPPADVYTPPASPQGSADSGYSSTGGGGAAAAN
ncbi:Long-chain base-1-phosphate phosphatase [Hypoxylon texense]